MNDATGKMSTNYLDFTITGTVTTEALMYELEVANSNVNINNYLKLYLTNQQNEAIAGPFLYSELYDGLVQNRKGIHQDMMEVNLDGTSKTITRNYRLRMWIDESIPDTSGVTATVSVYLYAKNTNNTKSHLISLNAGDGRSIKKVVVEGETYGSLPTPTKEGYTFLGWNGKNLFNVNAAQGFPSSIALSNTTARTFDLNTRVVGLAFNNHYSANMVNDASVNNDSISLTASSGYGIAYPIKSEANKNYTLIFSNNYNSNDTQNSIMYYEENGTLINYNYKSYGSGNFTRNFVTPDNTYYLLIMFGSSNPSVTKIISNIQLEEGTMATAYEPYFVTSDVKVTEWNTDMVLKAIWQANS